MSTNKPDIALIRKYLNGELNERAMYDLERQAHSDPFLMDVIRGMEAGNDKEDGAHLDAINGLIKQRVQRDTRRIVPLWKSLPIAASLLIALGIGGWWLTSQRSKQLTVLNHQPVQQPDHVKADAPLPVAGPVVPAGHPHQVAKVSRGHSRSVIASATISDQSTGADTVALLSSVANDKINTFKKEGDTKSLGYLSNARATVIKGGAPAQLSEIRIRGSNTLSGQHPLYIVDGIPMDSLKVSSINPADIKSINVLKDASATAVYGSRAANGVIVLNTKSGLLASKQVNIPGSTNQYKTGLAAANESGKKPVMIGKADTMLGQALAGRVAGVSISQQTNLPLVITGQVIDQHDGRLLPGVSVAVAGKQRGTVTDVNGSFKIAVSQKDTLTIASIGYEKQQVRIKGKDSLKIMMTPTSGSLSEVVVVGYGTMRKPAQAVSEDARPAIGWKAYHQYLKEQTAAPVKKAGKVKLAFTIDSRGNANHIRIVKGLTGDVNEKAIDILKNGPKWIDDPADPGKELRLTIKFHQ